MSYSKLINPKKKRRVFVPREPPFPIPIASITGEQSTERQWMYYTGNLVGNQVIVSCTGDISHMYKMGFFGKGTLSRSKPEFNQKCKVTTLPTSEVEDVTCRVTSRRSYIRRLNWKRGNKDPQFEEFDSSQELLGEETCFMDEEIQNTENSCTLSLSKKEDHSDTDEKVELNGSEISQYAEKDDWSAAVESWDNTEGDKDFWGVPSTDEPQPSTSRVGTNRNDFAVEKHKINVWESSEGDKNFWGNETRNVVTSPDKPTDLPTEHPCLEELPQGSGVSKSTSVDQSKLLAHCDHHDCLKNSQVDQHVQCLHETKNGSFETRKIDLPNAQDKEMEDADPLSLCEEEHGNLFVIEDSDDEMESRKRKRRWKSVMKEDPYFVKEFLHLSLEESFFLAYGLGCLRIYENEKLLNLTELWRAFCLRHDRFVPLYVAYHYFRSRGWVPKSGLKFGADFIIYKEGPPFYHGSYSVIVKMVREQDFQEEENSRTLTWTQLAGLNRLTEHVAKQLLICYVIKPENVTPDLMASPKVIGQFKVKEIVVSRWVSSQERESKTSAEEMP